MELAAKLHLCLHILEIVAEGQLSKLHAECELAALFHFVLVLDVRVHIAEE